jgi:hypothetical protein
MQVEEDRSTPAKKSKNKKTKGKGNPVSIPENASKTEVPPVQQPQANSSSVAPFTEPPPQSDGQQVQRSEATSTRLAGKDDASRAKDADKSEPSVEGATAPGAPSKDDVTALPPVRSRAHLEELLSGAASKGDVTQAPSGDPSKDDATEAQARGRAQLEGLLSGAPSEAVPAHVRDVMLTSGRVKLEEIISKMPVGETRARLAGELSRAVETQNGGGGVRTIVRLVLLGIDLLERAIVLDPVNPMQAFAALYEEAEARKEEEEGNPGERADDRLEELGRKATGRRQPNSQRSPNEVKDDLGKKASSDKQKEVPQAKGTGGGQPSAQKAEGISSSGREIGSGRRAGLDGRASEEFDTSTGKSEEAQRSGLEVPNRSSASVGGKTAQSPRVAKEEKAAGAEGRQEVSPQAGGRKRVNRLGFLLAADVLVT